MEHPYTNEHAFEKVAIAGDGGGWDWSLAGVWKDKTTGKLYGDSDSGCSCYGPFEGTYELGDLIEIQHVRDAGELADKVYDLSTTERQDFVRAVQVALASA